MHLTGLLLFIVAALGGFSDAFFGPGTWIPLPNIPWKRPELDLSFLFPDMTIQCSHNTLEAFLIQETPRMVYIKGFLTEAERKHLIEMSEPGYEQSFVYQPENQGAAQDTSFRKSETVIPPRDEVIRCIEQRARLSQPWRRGMGFEAISVQRYLPGGFFSHHWDSFDTSPDPDRRSTFNVFLAGNCTGGGTHFPMLPFPHDPTLCDVIDCQSDLEGTVFRPIAGNAIYWENVDPSGARYQETFHAGLPVTEGYKIGLNIWTWSFPDRI
ncbi:hypothetical protein BJX62DRAFT_230192 [Aspergillus germanicus]